MQQAALYPDILGCGIDRWTHNWGDPLLRGSISMLLYGVVGLLFLRVAQRTGAGDRRIWRVCAILFFLQMLNTHLDLHAFPAAFGHCLAIAQGWYAERGPVKLVGMVLIGAVIAAIVIVAAIVWRRSICANPLLVAGVAVALGVTLLKGAGGHAAEEVYSHELGPFRWADLLQYGGIVLAAWAGSRRLHRLRHCRGERRQPQT